MKRIIYLVFSLSILLGFTQCNKSNPDILKYDAKYTKKINKIRKQISYFLVRNYIPGGTFSISREGKTIYSEGQGWASKDLEVPVKRNTKFRIGEVSELFTSVIYVKLIEEGVIHPDSTVQFYLNDYPEKEFKIKLKHLAQHTSGMIPARNLPVNSHTINLSLQKGIDHFKDYELAFKPETYQELNTNNFDLLGAVMEKASGKSYSKLLKEYVTDTLQLENTEIDNPFNTIKNRSNFFDKNMVAQVVNATTTDLRHSAPSQGILSTSDDLIKFGNAILHSDYLAGKTHDLLFEELRFLDAPSQLSNGWITYSDNQERPFIGRGGTVTGGGSALIIFPEQDFVIACAVNLTTEAEEIPIFELANIFLGEPEKESSSKK